MAEHLASSTTSDESSPRSPSVGRHLAVGLVFIVPMLLVAVMFGRQGSTTATAAATSAPVASAPAAEPGAAAEPAAAAAAGTANAPQPKGLKSELEDLSAQLKTIRGLVDGRPKAEPAVDLKLIAGKIDEVSGAIAGAKPLVEKVEKLGGRIGEIGKQIESLEAEVAALKKRTSAK